MVSTPHVRVADPVLRPGASRQDNHPVPGVRSWSRWWVVVLPIALLLTFTGWAVTSPVGSSPDDDYHLSSIWCAGGERAGVCERSPSDSDVRLVPENVGFAHECFAYDAAVTAACAGDLTRSLVPTDRVNDVQGLYPSGFYRVMGLFVGPDEERSVLVMRVLNALIVIALLAVALRILTPAIRSALVVVFAVVYVPLGLFIVPSTNPSSWTLTGITFLWAFGLALAHRSDWRSRRTWVLALATVLSAGLAIGSRVDASAYVAAVVVVVLLLAGMRRVRAAWISTALLVAIGLIGLARFATFGTPGSGVSGGMGGVEPSAGLFLTNVVYLPVYLSGAVGGMALGWNDVFLPPLIFVFGVLALGGLAYRGMQSMPRGKALASLFALASLIAVPLVFLQREGLGVGEVVQARYLLPLIILLFLTLSVAVPYTGNSAAGLAMPRAAAIALGVGMTASASLALWVNAHRFASGANRGLFDIDLELEWTGLLPVPLPLIVGLGVLATIGYVAMALLGVYRDADHRPTVGA